MFIRNELSSRVRYGLVFLAWGVVTFSYYSFHHAVHHMQRHSEQYWKNHTHSGGNHSHSGGDHGDSGHGRGGGFDRIHDGKDWLFLYGLALPIALLTVVALIWKPSGNPGSARMQGNYTALPGTSAATRTLGIGSNWFRPRGGDVDVQKWTIIWFVLPLFLVMYDGARGHGYSSHSSSSEKHAVWDLYIKICMSLMSPSGYAATWSLSLFLIPVSKHSPILDWLRVTPVQALAFHRISGWVGFWNSVLHGFLHLRHLMDVLNPLRVRPWYQQLKILLIPSSWKCIATQNPFQVFFGNLATLEDPEDAKQCWLALVNATGMISVLAYLVLAITSIAWVRRYSYTLFYRTHIPAAWIMLFNAIWHYPTCALILIPNIIYYLSFHIPVSVLRFMEDLRSNKAKSGPLVTANLIQGGSVELIFATKKEERRRHENRFVKLFHPSISPVSHPFSVFSRQELIGTGNDEHDVDNSSLEILSILLRPTGAFTEGSIKTLFPSHSAGAEESSHFPPAVSSMSSHHKLQFESYYAGSFDWVDRAMEFHDEILLVAGGVGIVPFLEFLPALQQRIATESMSTPEAGMEEALIESTNPRFGPTGIHFHWYCREIGLASHIWHTYLRRHVHAWERNAACQGRLKIYLHLTSLDASEEVKGEDLLQTIPNAGLEKQETYSATGGPVRPTQDAHFTQSRLLALLLPGSLVVIGTVIHWLWYKHVTISDRFRDDGLVLRSHSVVFTLLLAVALAFLVEHCLERFRDTTIVAPSLSDDDMLFEAVEGDQKDLLDDAGTIGSLLLVTTGRPAIDTVVDPMLKAKRPGVYSCGPHALLESVEGSIRGMRADCAFYREDSDM